MSARGADIMRRMKLADFDYEFPEELIAPSPSKDRADSRLLRLNAVSGHLKDCRFVDFPDCVFPGDVLVVNDTKVIKARLVGVKESGGKVEALIERILGRQRVLAMLRANHRAKVGSRFRFGDTLAASVVERRGELYVLEFDGDVLKILDRVGRVPLPPYIDRDPLPEDEGRYQTIYASVPGAVAAPTAGLHFDSTMLDKLQALGVICAKVTLHVGAGTFQPVRTENVDEHVMHSEWYEVPGATVEAVARARMQGGRVVAVGTTSLRALESAAQSGELRSGSGETNLFVRPGFSFKVVDGLLTNFHLPKSTLMMLVSAFAGMENIRRSYRHAIASGYRLFSYGDAMFIDRLGGR